MDLAGEFALPGRNSSAQPTLSSDLQNQTKVTDLKHFFSNYTLDNWVATGQFKSVAAGILSLRGANRRLSRYSNRCHPITRGGIGRHETDHWNRAGWHRRVFIPSVAPASTESSAEATGHRKSQTKTDVEISCSIDRSFEERLRSRPGTGQQADAFKRNATVAITGLRCP